MKITKLVGGSLLLATAMCFDGLNSSASMERFHSGTVGKCEGCHLAESGGRVQESGYNLRGSDASSTCLLCHQAPPSTQRPDGHYVSTADEDLAGGRAPAQLTPGGDFGWLKKSYSWKNDAGIIEVSSGDSHGHNIIALDFDHNADGIKIVAPGGRYPSGNLSCISCHDPHGNYRRNTDGSITSSGSPIVSSGSYRNSPDPDANAAVGTYRLLAGKGYFPKAIPGVEPFTADPPAAVAPESYNRSERESDTRVAYGSGMSEWCQNCHTQMHSVDGQQHLAGDDARFSSEITRNYRSYVKSGDINGWEATAYTSLVPYEIVTRDYGALKTIANSDGSNLSGPGGAGEGPKVSCLSCHRAHASGWSSMTRWNAGATMIVENGSYPGTDNGGTPDQAQGRTEAEARQAYYDRPASRFAFFQRSLCNKCHIKD